MNMAVGKLVEALGWALVHSAWQGVLAGAGVWVLSRGGSAARRYVVHCLGLGTLLVCFGTSFWLQVNGPTVKSANFPAVTLVSRTTRAVPVQSPFRRERRREATRIDRDEVVRAMGWTWFAGVLVMSLRATRAAWAVRRLRASAMPWGDQEWQAKLKEWVKELGIKRAVRLCLTSLNDVPSVIGHFKPLVLLPAGLITRLSPGELEALILHELMHIRRNDYLVNLLQVICETLLFFHPVAWWLSRSIRREREHCCDDAVCGRDQNPVLYAKALLALEELRLQPEGVLSVAAGGGSLKMRISRLLAPERATARMGGWTAPVFLLVLVAAALGFLGWPKVQAQATPKEGFFEMRLVVDEGGEELPFVGPKGYPSKLRVGKEIILNEGQVKDAKAEKNPTSGDPQIRVDFNNEGAALFAKRTKDNIGRQLAVIVNKQIVCAPRIASAITGGSVVITGNFSEEEATQIATKLTNRADKTRSNPEPATKTDRITNNTPISETIPAVAPNPRVQRIIEELRLENENLAKLRIKYRDKWPAVIASKNRIAELKAQFAEENGKGEEPEWPVPGSIEKAGEQIQKRPSLALEAHFIKSREEPITKFSLNTKIDSSSDEFTAWSLTQEEARAIVRQARQGDAATLVSSPAVTTTFGNAVRVEVGSVPDQQESSTKAPTPKGVYSVNATGYVITKNPTQSESLIGQSVELLPEAAGERWIVAGKFMDREKVSPKVATPFVRTMHSAPFYVAIPKGGAFALEQKSKVPEAGGRNYLLLVVIPEER